MDAKQQEKVNSVLKRVDMTTIIILFFLMVVMAYYAMLQSEMKQKIIENVQEYLSEVSSDYAKRIDRRFTDYKSRKYLYGEQWADEWLYLVWDYA